jgi:DNA-binding MarR family transcriptional regulator
MSTPFISDIGRAMGMDQTTVTRNVEILERLEFVLTTPHLDDPRKKVVTLTHTGQSKLVEAFPLWQKAQDKISAHLGEKQLEAFHELLQAVSEVVKKPWNDNSFGK